MTIFKQAVRGAVWTIGLGIASRVVGAIGTIIIARFIVPEVMGEVLAAWIVASLGHTITRMGLDQYLIVKGQDGDDVPFHTTFWSFVFGVVGLGAVVLVGDSFGVYLNAPSMGQYLPGCVVAVAIRRVASIPDRILVRDMRFRTSAISQALGELSYVATALILASAFAMGGFAIVIGNIVQSLVILGVLLAATNLSQWLAPCRITWRRTRDMLRFGMPLNFETALNLASRMVDNLMFSYRFGAGSMGLYNMAYNLADVPAAHIGEHIGSVLLPSMSRIEPERRARVLVRSIALLALLVFPLAVGLGAVADPLVHVLLPDEWQGVAPLLMVLAALSIFRPVSWVVASYLKVAERTGIMFWLEAFKLVLLLGGIALLPTPVCASISVGVAFGAHAMAMVLCVTCLDKISLVRFVPGFLGPALACVPMVAAVLGARHGLPMMGVHDPLVSLIVEIVAGAAIYVPAAFVCAPGTARDLLALLRSTYGRASTNQADKHTRP